MARIDYNSGSDGGGAEMRVAGLYAALLMRERAHQQGHDQFTEDHRQYGGARSMQLLDALEAGRPVVLQGRRLKGRGIPMVPLRREQAFAWFSVSRDDRVVSTDSPEDEADCS